MSRATGASGAALRMAFLLNLGFTLLELVGGALTNSLAIISGAVHDLGVRMIRHGAG